MTVTPLRAADVDPVDVPCDLAAEQAVLGSALLSGHALDECAAMVSPGDFYRPAHQIVWEHLTAMRAAGQYVDAITLAAHLAKAGALTRVGGGAYLHTLVASVPTAANAVMYARIVADTAARRRGLEAVLAAAQRLRTPSDLTAEEILEQARQALVPAGPAEPESDEAAWIEVDHRAGTPDNSPVLPTGLPDLDRYLDGGLRGGQLVIVGARPGGYKSVFVLQVARHTAITRRQPAWLGSLEMAQLSIRQRTKSAEYGAHLSRVRSGHLHDDEMARLIEDRHRINSAPLRIVDKNIRRLSQLCASIRRAHHRAPLALAAVDYLQLVDVDASSGHRSRQQELGQVSRALKALALELDIPVLAAAQVNRGPEQRADRRPMLSDLREAGDIENDADIVIFLHREDPEVPEMEAIVAKNRDGPAFATVRLHAEGHHARLVSAGPHVPAQSSRSRWEPE